MKERLVYLDVMRGFTMFLVVFGHVAYHSFGIQVYDSHVTHFFVTFRMPMFFFLSGYLGYKAILYWDVSFFKERLKLKSFVQLVPMIIFFSISQIIHGHNPLATYFSIGLGGYWFTFVLFEMFLIYYIIALLAHYFVKSISFILFPIAIMGVIFLVVIPRTGMLYQLLCLENLFKYFQFFVLGLYFKKYKVQTIDFLRKEYVKLAIIIAFFTMYISICSGILESHRLVYQVVHDVLIRYVGVLMVYAFFLHIGEKLNADSRITKVVSYTGKHTLDIYLLHYFFLPDLSKLAPLLENNNQPLFELLCYSLVACLIIALCLGVQYILCMSTTLQYWLFGKK